MNILFVCLTAILMVFSKFERVVCSFFGIWAGILILLKMLFQLNIAQQIEWHTNCTVSGMGLILRYFHTFQLIIINLVWNKWNTND